MELHKRYHSQQAIVLRKRRKWSDITMHHTIKQHVAVGTRKRSCDRCSPRNLRFDLQPVALVRVKSPIPESEPYLTNWLAYKKNEEGHTRGTQVRMEHSMNRPQSLGHVIERLSVNDDLGNPEDRQTERLWHHRFQCRSGTKMKRRKWHNRSSAMIIF